MNAATERELRHLIRHEIADYTPVRDIPGFVLESMEEDADGITKKQAAALTKELLEAQLRRQQRRPKTTDNDRLQAAFARLEEQGIVARENFSCCGTCGASDMRDEVAEQEAQGRTIRGCVFFHQQDTDRAIEGGGLYFSFFSVDRQNNRRPPRSAGC